jgi:hypothetical protein
MSTTMSHNERCRTDENAYHHESQWNELSYLKRMARLACFWKEWQYKSEERVIRFNSWLCFLGVVLWGSTWFDDAIFIHWIFDKWVENCVYLLVNGLNFSWVVLWTKFSEKIVEGRKAHLSGLVLKWSHWQMDYECLINSLATVHVISAWTSAAFHCPRHQCMPRRQPCNLSTSTATSST